MERGKVKTRFIIILCAQLRNGKAPVDTTDHYQHTIGSRLAVINRYDSEFFKSRCREWGLGTHDIAVLMQLDRRGELYQDEIVASTHINKATLSKIASKLFGMGLIYTRKSPDDKRVVFMGLTDTGKEIMPKIHDLTKEWMALITDGFSDDERQQLVSFLDRMLDNIRARY